MKLTPQQYERIKDLLPRQRGNVKMSNLDFLNAVLYVAESGCKWRRLPKRFGNWHTVYTRMNRWAKKGLLGQVLAELQRQGVVRVKVDEFASRAYGVRGVTPQEHAGDSSPEKDGFSACPELRGNLRKQGGGLSEKEIENRIRPRIEELRGAAIEEKSEGQLPLSNDSYRGLARFLNKLVDMGMYLVPELDLTYEGNIRAEWESSDEEFLILEFVDFSRLKFIFFYPDSSSGGTFRTSGSGSVSDFLDHHPRAMKFLRDLCGNLREPRSGLSEKEIEDRIRPRIEELREAAIEEESEGLGQLPLSNDSYRGLINFLKRVSDSGIEAVPGLALTYEGNIVAEWESSPDEVLSLEFLDSSSLKFVFFYQCSDLADKILRISGSGSVSGFLDGNPNALKFLRSVDVAG